MKTFQKFPGKTNGKMYILVTESGADEDGIVTRKSGFIEVQPDKVDAVLEKLESEAIIADFGPLNNQGNYIVVTRKVTAPEHVVE